MPGYADREIVKRLLAGDEDAFSELVDAYHGRLVRLAHTFVRDRHAAEEVVGETWLGVLKGLARYEGRASLKSWIFRILTNRAKTRGVRDKRSVPFSALSKDDAPAVDPTRFHENGSWADPPSPWQTEDPEEILLRGETRAKILDAIRQLPLTQQTVITMRDIEGIDSTTVCNSLEISETNQRVLLHRARIKVRESLERELGERPNR